MNKIRRSELNRIALVIKAATADLAAVIAEEEKANARMAINTDNEIYSCHALDAMDRASVAAAALRRNGEALNLYEVYDGVTAELVEAFKTLEEAVDYIDNQAAWNELIAALPVMDCIVKY